MANGLLDFFGKDYEDPRTQGLLQFGLGLMQAGGYQDRPVSLGQAIGAGGRQGMQAYQQAVAQKQKKQQLADAKRLQDLQIGQIKAQLAKSSQEAEAIQAQNLARSRLQTAQRMGFKDMFGNPLPPAQVQSLYVGAYPELGQKLAEKALITPEPVVGTYEFEGDVYKTVDGVPDFTAPIKRGTPEAPKLEVLTPTREDVIMGGVAGSVNVDYLPLDDPRIKELGGDPVTGRVVLSDSFIAEKPEQQTPPGTDGYVFQDGEVIGFSIEGDLQNVRGFDGKEFARPEGATSMSEEAWLKSTMSRAKFDELEKELNEQKVARTKLVKFAETRDMAKEGFGLLADQLMTAGKTIFGDIIGKYGELTQSQLEAAIAEGQLNALIGSLRLETVGGGVMTEQDALRVVSRLGGNLNLLNNKQAVQRAIQEVLAEKDMRIQQDVNRYNREVKIRYKTIGRKPLSVSDFGISQEAAPSTPAPSAPAPSPAAADDLEARLNKYPLGD